MIKFDQVSKQYNQDFFIVYNLNFEIFKNTVFVGKADDGTNTILRLMSGLEHPSAGNIFIDNKDIKCFKNKDLPLSFIPKGICLFENKTVFENIIYPLKIRKISNNIAKNDVFDLFFDENIKLFLKNKNFDTNSFLKTEIKKLNCCEKKLVMLLRSMVRNPKYIIAENLLFELDEESKILFLKLIEKQSKNNFCTFILCEETDQELLKNFDKIAIESGSITF